MRIEGGDSFGRRGRQQQAEGSHKLSEGGLFLVGREYFGKKKKRCVLK